LAPRSRAKLCRSLIELPDERLNGLDIWAPIWRDSSGNVQRWGDENYQHLLKAIELFPPGEMHDDAQTRVERLDCARPIQGLVSCDPSAPWPDNANDWRNSLLDARVNASDYSSTLLAELKRLVCNAGGDDIYILRGIIENHRLHDPDVSASDIADLSKSVTDMNCPISTSIGPDHQELLLRFAKSAQS
jgi:hypothetical protein